MPKSPPPIREFENGIEIDMKKGEWPYIKMVRIEGGHLAIFVDCNPGGQVINSGQGLAAVTLSPKKAKALRAFLERTEEP